MGTIARDMLLMLCMGAVARDDRAARVEFTLGDGSWHHWNRVLLDLAWQL